MIEVCCVLDVPESGTCCVFCKERNRSSVESTRGVGGRFRLFLGSEDTKLTSCGEPNELTITESVRMTYKRVVWRIRRPIQAGFLTHLV